MNKKIIVNKGLALILMVFLCESSVADTNQPNSLVPLMLYLKTVGDKLDCYFTLEWHQKDGESYGWHPIPDDPSVSSVSDLINKFRRDTPEIELFQDTNNPRIVHVITRNMKNSPDQVLNQKIMLAYRGAARELPDTISDHTNGGIGYSNWHYFPPITPDDGHTIVDIKANNSTVRSILSDFMPLSRYSCFLWLAFDAQVGSRYCVRVYYYGAGYAHPYTGDPNDKTRTYPFSDARNAYFLNPLSDKLAADATKFVTDGFASGKTLNVRWAMYYLGKHKVENAIPLLLEHLDYRYTTVPVLAEAYPAVHALLDMGKLANAPVQKQMQAETDPLRLQLLCAVMLGVNGAYDGRKLTTETASKLPETQEKRVMDALRLAEDQLIAVPPPVDSVSTPLPKDFIPTQEHPFPPGHKFPKGD